MTIRCRDTMQQERVKVFISFSDLLSYSIINACLLMLCNTDRRPTAPGISIQVMWPKVLSNWFFISEKNTCSCNG